MFRLQEILNIMKSEDGDELFENVVAILNRFGVRAFNEDGSVRDLYALCCDVVEVLNKEK